MTWNHLQNQRKEQEKGAVIACGKNLSGNPGEKMKKRKPRKERDYTTPIRRKKWQKNSRAFKAETEKMTS